LSELPNIPVALLKCGDGSTVTVPESAEHKGDTVLGGGEDIGVITDLMSREKLV